MTKPRTARVVSVEPYTGMDERNATWFTAVDSEGRSFTWPTAVEARAECEKYNAPKRVKKVIDAG
jgi:hypothetical protein